MSRELPIDQERQLAPELRRRDLPLCETCELQGACQIGVDDLRMTEDGKVVGRFGVPPGVRGHVVAHGGWIAWMFDEALGLLPSGHGVWGITSGLSIRYLRPTPIGADVVVTAWVVRKEGRSWHVEGELRLAEPDTLLASASGEWVTLDDMESHYERVRDWCQKVTGKRP